MVNGQEDAFAAAESRIAELEAGIISVTRISLLIKHRLGLLQSGDILFPTPDDSDLLMSVGLAGAEQSFGGATSYATGQG